MRQNRGQVAAAIVIVIACALNAAAQNQPALRLTLTNAITLALKHNLNVLVSASQVDQMQGTEERRLSLLLPHASGDALANRKNNNLSVAGISIPGFPSVVGPFSYYDFRVSANQSLIDRQAYHDWKASEKQEQVAKLDYQDARDLVIREAAAFYLDSESAAAEVQAAESRVTTSETLEKLTHDQHAQGLATGVDVTRAEVQLARDRQNLLVTQDTYQTSLLALARFLGLDPGTTIELAEQLQFSHVEIPNLDQALQNALASRSDYRALLTQRDSLVEQQKASRARYWPTFAINGDYGALGRNFGFIPGIGEIQGTLTVTLFDRDRNGEARELTSRVKALDDQIADLARGIEEELRKAALDLQSTEQQVSVTQAAADLAQQELKLAEDRFRNGVTDNIEVVTAQDALSAAEDEHITALAQHADAQAALARALGATEQNYQKYLDGSAMQGSEESPGGAGERQ
jgi:outer membrane protein TolC